MSTTDNGSKETNSSPGARDEIIKTAIKFLQNPHVSKSPLPQSQKFLRSKGLTDEEIRIACERSGVYNVQYLNEQPPSLPMPATMQQIYASQPQTLLMKVRDTLQSVAVFSGMLYALYLFYKKFIKPWLFGEKKKKTIEDSLTDLNKSVTESINDLRDNLSEVRVQVDRINNLQSGTTNSQLQDLKSEIASVKGLLLNRKAFRSVSNNVVPPSIPAWQLSSVQPEQDADCKEELMEIGSGSGSSETEVVTKNSDSSLEIM